MSSGLQGRPTELPGRTSLKVYVSEKQRAALEKERASTGESLGAVVRKAIEAYLDIW